MWSYFTWFIDWWFMALRYCNDFIIINSFDCNWNVCAAFEPLSLTLLLCAMKVNSGEMNEWRGNRIKKEQNGFWANTNWHFSITPHTLIRKRAWEECSFTVPLTIRDVRFLLYSVYDIINSEFHWVYYPIIGIHPYMPFSILYIPKESLLVL